MAGWTLEKAQAAFDRWLAADEAVATGQEYEIAGRRLTRADAELITENLDKYDKKIKELTENAEGGLVTSQMTIIDT